MNKYYILLQTIRTLVIVLLFILPLIYCIYKGNFKKGFWFTWIVWSVVIFIYGITLPAIAVITEKATGIHADISCGGFVLGVFFGWLPALIISSLGGFIHNLFLGKKDESETIHS